MRGSGTYALVIFLGSRIHLRIGGLGIHSFPPSYYVYVGSALGGLPSRLKHHLKPEKRLHWHIDYFLRQAKLAQIWYTLGQDRLECIWNEIISNLPGATSFIRGFGASDCQCYSHLTYFAKIPSFGLFKQKLWSNNLPQAHRVNNPEDCTRFNSYLNANSLLAKEQVFA